jgi:hypothetical protein
VRGTDPVVHSERCDVAAAGCRQMPASTDTNRDHDQRMTLTGLTKLAAAANGSNRTAHR